MQNRFSRLRALTIGGLLAAVLAAGATVPAVAATPVAAGAHTAVLAAASSAAPRITTQPASASRVWGSRVTFTVKASGTGVSYSWYLKKPGGSWQRLSTHGTSLSFVTAPSYSGYQYRAIAKNAKGYTISRTATLKVTRPVTIRTIAGKTAKYGSTATIVPAVTTSGKTSVSAKRLTVKRGSTNVATNKSSVRLKAGTYRVTTKVTYRTYTDKSVTKNVTTKKVGVSAWDDVSVTCTASAVNRAEYEESMKATCTSPKFDGSRKVVTDLFGDDVDGWIGYTDVDDWIEFDKLPRVGAKFTAVLSPDDDLMKSTTVRKTTTSKVWSATKTTQRTQNLVIKQGAKPSRTSPISTSSCPSWAPIKGNASSMIYHVPGGRWYAVTNPEECFTTTSAARSAGYRASKNG